METYKIYKSPAHACFGLPGDLSPLTEPKLNFILKIEGFTHFFKSSSNSHFACQLGRTNHEGGHAKHI